MSTSRPLPHPNDAHRQGQHPSSTARAATLPVKAAPHSTPKTSRFAGVSRQDPRPPYSRTVRWRAQISDSRLGSRAVPLGSHRTENNAALAYDLALIFAGAEPINFPAIVYQRHPVHPAVPAMARHVASRILGPPPHDPERFYRSPLFHRLVKGP